MQSVEHNLKLLEDIHPGDEIHFTDGTIWSCVYWWEEVAFVPMSLEQLRDNENYSKEQYSTIEFKGILTDAIKGGAQISKGIKSLTS